MKNSSFFVNLKMADSHTRTHKFIHTRGKSWWNCCFKKKEVSWQLCVDFCQLTATFSAVQRGGTRSHALHLISRMCSQLSTAAPRAVPGWNATRRTALHARANPLCISASRGLHIDKSCMELRLTPRAWEHSVSSRVKWQSTRSQLSEPFCRVTCFKLRPTQI